MSVTLIIKFDFTLDILIKVEVHETLSICIVTPHHRGELFVHDLQLASPQHSLAAFTLLATEVYNLPQVLKDFQTHNHPC